MHEKIITFQYSPGPLNSEFGACTGSKPFLTPGFPWRPIAMTSTNVSKQLACTTRTAMCMPTSIVNARNWHRVIELGVLQIIRKCLDATQCSGRGLPPALTDCAAARMLVIMNEICSSVPYHTGDVMQPTIPILSDEISVPQAFVSSPTCSERRTFPKSKAEHPRQVASSGMWMIHGTLPTVLKLIEQDHGNASRLVLRDGQLEWIKGQLFRLLNVFYFPGPLEYFSLLQHPGQTKTLRYPD
jgi:hypothetical protein